jgi:hypothetical protein
MKLSVFFSAFASAWHSVNGKQDSTFVQCEGDTVGWVNSYGDGCNWYEVNDLPGCPNFGPNWDGGMGVAVADPNCCYCTGTGVSVITRIIPQFIRRLSSSHDISVFS